MNKYNYFYKSLQRNKIFRFITPWGLCNITLFSLLIIFNSVNSNSKSNLSYFIFLLFSIFILSFFHYLFLIYKVKKSKITFNRIIPSYGYENSVLTYKIAIENNDFGYFLLEDKEHLLMINDADIIEKQPYPKINIFDRFTGYKKWFDLNMQKLKSIIPFVIVQGTEKEVNIEIQLKKHGILHLNYLDIQIPSFFNFFNVKRRFFIENQLYIYPKENKFNIKLVDNGESYQKGIKKYSNKRGNNNDFIGLKSYYNGDLIKNISWKHYAKMDELLVREYQQEYSVKYGFIIDNFFNQYLINNDILDKIINFSFNFIKNTDLNLFKHIIIGKNMIDIKNLNNKKNLQEYLLCLEQYDNKDFFHLYSPLKKSISDVSCYYIILNQIDEKREDMLKMLLSYKKQVVIYYITNEENINKNLVLIKKYNMNVIDIHNYERDLLCLK